MTKKEYRFETIKILENPDPVWKDYSVVVMTLCSLARDRGGRLRFRLGRYEYELKVLTEDNDNPCYDCANFELYD